MARTQATGLVWPATTTRIRHSRYRQAKDLYIRHVITRCISNSPTSRLRYSYGRLGDEVISKTGAKVLVGQE